MPGCGGSAMMHAQPERPVPFQGDLRNLPEALAPLKELPNWVCWRWEWRVDKKGIGKWTKPPLRPKTPAVTRRTTIHRHGAPMSRRLAAFEAGQCDGIGFNLSGTDIAAFDIDKCRDPATGDIAPEAMAIVDRATSYTEMTASGTGLRVIGYGTGAKMHRKQKLPGSAVEVESYRNAERYIVITGNPLPADMAAHGRHRRRDRRRCGGTRRLQRSPARQSRQDKAQQDFDDDSRSHRPNAGPASADPGSAGADTGDAFLPGDLIELIEKGVPPQDDLSAAFHHAVCWLARLWLVGGAHRSPHCRQAHRSRALRKPAGAGDRPLPAQEEGQDK